VLAAQRPLFGAALAFSVVMSVFALTSSFYMLEVFDRVLTSRSVETLLLLTLIALAGLAVFGALDGIRRQLLMRVGLKVADALSDRVLAAVVATNAQVGGGAYRTAMRDVDTLRGFLGSPTCAALFDIPFLLLYLVVLFFLSPWFLLVVVIGAAVLGALAAANHLFTSKLVAESTGISLKAQAFAEDGMRNADVLEGMGMSPTFVAKWRGRWLEAMRISTAAADRDAMISTTSKSMRMVIQVALMACGALLILSLHATGGVMIGATIIGSRAVQPIELVIGSWKTLVQVRTVIGRLNQLLENAPRRDEGMPLPAPQGHLRVNGVTFLVPQTRRSVLANVSLELQPGEMLGVIGPSASGKSTLGRLLVGAWPCSSGAVRLDGANIYSWPRGDLGRYIGYLPQEVELFAGSVRDNIARMTDGEPEAVVKAAMRAHAHEMILALPQGYETEVGSDGHWLSGGQRQRVGLARALFGEPRFVMLDEPNSNLDSAGEQALAATLADLKAAAVTTVVIAHRPSILGSVDKILVLAPGGAVAAFGPADEIMARFTSQPPPPARGGRALSAAEASS
jgi:PrtD family type I secretion system ABC transporter